MENYILVKKYVGNIFNRTNSRKKFSLNEGLIQTYSINKLVKHARQYCNFASSVEEYNSGDYQGVIKIVNASNGTQAISVVFQKSKYNENLIDNMFNAYGYFKSNVEELDENFICIEYECKFDKIFKQQLLNKKYIYHLTTEKKAERILINGLKVHTNDEMFSYPERTYFFINNMPDDFLKEFFNEKIEGNNNYKNQTFYKVNLVLLKINVEPIIDKVKFYNDPNMDNGIYTEDYIPPQIITIERKINYKILKKGNGEVIERK